MDIHPLVRVGGVEPPHFVHGFFLTNQFHFGALLLRLHVWELTSFVEEDLCRFFFGTFATVSSKAVTCFKLLFCFEANTDNQLDFLRNFDSLCLPRTMEDHERMPPRSRDATCVSWMQVLIDPDGWCEN